MFAIYQKFITDLLSTESKEIKPSSQELEQTTIAIYTVSGHLSCHVTAQHSGSWIMMSPSTVRDAVL